MKHGMKTEQNSLNIGQSTNKHIFLYVVLFCQLVFICDTSHLVLCTFCVIILIIKINVSWSMIHHPSSNKSPIILCNQLPLWAEMVGGRLIQNPQHHQTYSYSWSNCRCMIHISWFPKCWPEYLLFSSEYLVFMFRHYIYFVNLKTLSKQNSTAVCLYLFWVSNITHNSTL